MPIVKTFNIDTKTRLYLWEVRETLAVLQEQVKLTPEQTETFGKIHNERAQKNFLATRLLLQEVGYSSKMLFYDPYGRPYLNDGQQISISHSFDRVAVIISDQAVGVDIEKKRDKIKRVARKFTQWNYQSASFSDENIIQKLTMTWCAKEVGFKIHNNPTLTLNDIKVRDFFPNDVRTDIKVEDTIYEVYFAFIDDFVLGYCVKKLS
nr:4'-phosphopantetheinyl transferase superfamily protein [uncultured Capnocytophaga sp.]